VPPALPGRPAPRPRTAGSQQLKQTRRSSSAFHPRRGLWRAGAGRPDDPPIPLLGGHGPEQGRAPSAGPNATDGASNAGGTRSTVARYKAEQGQRRPAGIELVDESTRAAAALGAAIPTGAG